MGILTKLFSGNKKGYFHELGSYGSLSGIFGGNSSQQMSDDELLSLYKGWVFGCSDLIGDGMSSLNKALYKTEQKQNTINHKYFDLIDSELIKAIAIFLKTLGVVYIYKETLGNKVSKLLLLKSQNIQVMRGALGNVLSYNYYDGYKFYEFKQEDLIILKSFTPFISASGMSPLKAVATQVATDLSSVEFNKLFFENGGKPGTIFKHAAKIDSPTRDKYIAKWKEQFSGLKNAHKVAFLDQGIEIVDFSANQKDMELTSQRTFTMDEVLMIFRVPKPLMGKSDGVGFADKNVPGYYFAEYCLKPLARLIEDELNEQLFKGIGYFSFEFVQDKGDLLKEYQSNVITQNQYLLGTGRPAVKNGDRLWDGTEVIPMKEKQVSESRLEKSLGDMIKKTFKTKEFGTDGYNEKIWKTKIKRTDLYENQMAKIQKKIFSAQEKEILKNLNTKSVKEIRKESDLFDSKKSNLVYVALYTKFFEDMIGKEGAIAMTEISAETFSIAKMNVWIGENIDRMSKDIDEVTRKEMFEIIKQGNRDQVGAAQIAVSIRSKFNQYTRKSGRVEKIVRTEVTRASNKSQDEAYSQSGVVELKEWYTALDERVSQECAVLHGKRIKIGGTFLKKGEKDELGNKITYETIDYPPRHVNCRCTLRPIIARKSLKNVQNLLKNKGVSLIINNNDYE